MNRANPFGWLYKSCLMATNRQIDSAVLFLDSALKYDSTRFFQDHNHFKGCYLMSYGQFDAALEAFNKVNTSEFDSLFLLSQLFNTSICYAQLGQLDKALDICDSLISFSECDSSVIKFCDSLRSIEADSAR